MFNLRHDLQQFEPSSDATQSTNDNVVFVDGFNNDAGDEQRADGTCGLFKSTTFDVQVWITETMDHFSLPTRGKMTGIFGN